MRLRLWAVAAGVSSYLALGSIPAHSAPSDSTSTGATPAPAAANSFTTPPPASTPPDYPRGRISGLVFADLYYNVDGNPLHTYNNSGGDQGLSLIDGVHPITRDLNSIYLRRLYFQLDNDLSVRFSTRFRLEVDSKSLTADGKITPFVKNAYLLAKSVIPRGDFYFGMINTPAFENPETFWKYRSLEKTIADFRGLASASDLGLSLKGFVDPNHHFGYWAMIGNGTGQKPETDKFKRFYLSLPMQFGDLRVEPYADYQPLRINLQPKVATNVDSLAVNQDQAMYKIFVGYDLRRFAVGFEAVDRLSHRDGIPNVDQRGFSVWARTQLRGKLDFVGRFDNWNSDLNLPNRVDTHLWIFGVDWMPIPDIHIEPNVEMVNYLKVGNPAVVPADNDIQARITFFYNFSRPQS
jgi:hypothetical protein